MTDHAGSARLNLLIAKLSDGTLSPEEALQLNTLLKQDPISQELYLDHMLVDGLLEVEYGLTVAESASVVKGERDALEVANHKSRSVTWSGSPRRLQVLASLIGIMMCFMVCLVLNVPSPREIQRQTLPLANPGFESGPISFGTAAASGEWYGDVADIVELQSGITPLEGNRMLRFLKSEFEPDDACEMYQLVDLGPMSEAISSGRVSVEASAYFNAIPHETPGVEYSFGVALFAYAGDPQQEGTVWPVRQPLSFIGQQDPADTDVGTWQPVMTRMAIPAGTTQLLVQLSVVRLKPFTNDKNAYFAGHYVDHVDLALVTQQDKTRWFQYPGRFSDSKFNSSHTRRNEYDGEIQAN